MEFTHLDKAGRGHMVEVGEKEDTKRSATAEGVLRMQRSTANKMKAGPLKKGDVHLQIGRAVQQECRDRARMPSSA